MRVNKMAPGQNAELKAKLYNLQRQPLPFHPLILVFSTGRISTNECVPMAREPMPAVGSPFSDEIVSVIKEGTRLNPSVHDGAIIFTRGKEEEEYRLSAWSMRIISKGIPDYTEPNVGSAHNSAQSLSLSPTVDLCAIISSAGVAMFEKGRISRATP
ncbi:hypothetical protein [Rhizobium sp. ZPR3]|uniref:Uncharacterized protein n=2 Tax=unclassified Rhizobium TaxID=2613769 RepID=A0AAU7SPR2_9HYPH